MHSFRSVPVVGLGDEALRVGQLAFERLDSIRVLAALVLRASRRLVRLAYSRVAFANLKLKRLRTQARFASSRDREREMEENPDIHTIDQSCDDL